jgi:1-phosphatidylinositol phosphodiesterase
MASSGAATQSHGWMRDGEVSGGLTSRGGDNAMPNRVPVYQHDAGVGASFRSAYNLSPTGTQGWSSGKVAFYADDGPTAGGNTVPVYAHSVATADGFYCYYDLQKANHYGWSEGVEEFWVPASLGPGVVPVYWSLTGHRSYHYSLQPAMLPQDDARVVTPPQTLFNAYAQLTYAHNWMSAIDDSASIAEISIPGSHESCARFGGSSAHCQWRSIIDQLNRGIRFLDVRFDYNAPKGNWACSPVDESNDPDIYLFARHDTMNQAVTFEEVQAQCMAFLNENPDEFILMNVQTERVTNPDAFRTKFLEQSRPYQQKYWYMKNTVPTKKECKGRIVLIRPYDPATGDGWSKGSDSEWPDGAAGGGLEWNGFDQPGYSSNTIFQTQNFWNTSSGTDKGSSVEQYMVKADAWAREGEITLNFASYSYGAQSPGANAAGMNPRLLTFLSQKAYDSSVTYGAVVGVVAIDFMSNTGDPGSNCLEDRIIEHQAHVKPGYVYGGRPV